MELSRSDRLVFDTLFLSVAMTWLDLWEAGQTSRLYLYFLHNFQICTSFPSLVKCNDNFLSQPHKASFCKGLGSTEILLQMDSQLSKEKKKLKSLLLGFKKKTFRLKEMQRLVLFLYFKHVSPNTAEGFLSNSSLSCFPWMYFF